MSEEVVENKIEEKTEEVKEKKPKIERERTGICHIFTSFNNTIVHITDLSGHTISRVSGGMMTKQDRLKANPTVAMFVAKKAAEVAKTQGIKKLYVKIKAKTENNSPGPGAHAAVKSLSKEGFNIISITDVTRVARGGPKAPGGKRGRRV